MRCKRSIRARSSGQLLIVAALAIAILISSTTIYVYELSRQTNNINTYSISDIILALKQSTQNTMISSLVNISSGGDKANLETNLNNLSKAFCNLRQLGISQLTFTVANNSEYESGTCLSWNTDGLGFSSACSDFALKVHGMTENIILDYAINITTAVTINGSYTSLIGEEKLVNLTCQVLNEEDPTLAQNITLFYENLGSWLHVNSSNNLSILDYGNGTYFFSFTVITSFDVQVSAHVYDLRSTFVQANTTCTEA